MDLLRNEEQFLLGISNLVTLGHCTEDFVHCDARSLSNSRRLTATNRLLRLYIRPSESLKKEIVGFILKYYMLVWFDIKKGKYFTEGPKDSIKPSKHYAFYPIN